MSVFPHPLSCDEDGLLAVGGQLTHERLGLAYRIGIFPWYNHPPILWWYTHPRAVLVPNEIKISKSMRSVLRKPWRITLNQAFEDVILGCRKSKRIGQSGTWITDDIMNAYVELHKMGRAHSVEVWQNDQLVGGLYGIISGKIFCGESMYADVSNASKVGLIWFARYLSIIGCELIDCQQDTDHLRSMGSSLIDKEEFWHILKRNILLDDMILCNRTFGRWKEEMINSQ